MKMLPILVGLVIGTLSTNLSALKIATYTQLKQRAEKAKNNTDLLTIIKFYEYFQERDIDYCQIPKEVDNLFIHYWKNLKEGYKDSNQFHTQKASIKKLIFSEMNQIKPALMRILLEETPPNGLHEIKHLHSLIIENYLE